MRASLSNSRYLVLCLLGTLAGCGPQYEIDRPGTWRATGANERNLRAMAADPRDLGYGQASLTERGNVASRAVTRILIDRRRPLMNASLSRVSPSGDTQDTPLASGGGAPTGAPAQ